MSDIPRLVDHTCTCEEGESGALVIAQEAEFEFYGIRKWKPSIVR